MHEFNIIRNYFSKLAKDKNSLNLNDDVFFDNSRNLVVSVDTYIEGIHFINFKKPELVIKKIIRSSLSDIICKGAIPKYYFISGSGNNQTFTKLNLKKISKSLKQEQDRFNITLGGGDTVISQKLSFTIISIGFAKNIIRRNNVKKNDDIYVTGNIGDSFAGLEILKKKIIPDKYLYTYFENKYYLPELYLKLSSKLSLFANSSIDISDGLISDLEKLINKQNLSYEIEIDKIPMSKNLKILLKKKKLKKKNFISQGDDYQILFTANKSKSRIVTKISKSLGIKISKIGRIRSSGLKSQIIDEKGMKIALKNKGYYHRF